MKLFFIIIIFILLPGYIFAQSEDNIVSSVADTAFRYLGINPIRYVLGLAQTAAVGYMAYRHIKKYGFWK